MVVSYFNKPLLRWPLAVGAVTGLLAFGYFLALYFLDISPLGNIRTPDFGIYMIMMAYGCWYYRKKYGNGLLHLWEALSICYVINMTAAFIAGWLIYFFITFADPTIYTNYIAEMVDLTMKGKDELVKNIGSEEFENLLNKIKQSHASGVITDEISKKLLMGIIPILIISLFFRRQSLQAPGEESK